MKNTIEKDTIIKQTKKHIKELRMNSDFIDETDFKIALGKVIIDIKDAKKHDSSIVKKIFSYD